MNKSQNKIVAALVLLSGSFEQVNADPVIDCTCWLSDNPSRFWLASTNDMGTSCDQLPAGFIGGRVASPASPLTDMFPNTSGCTDFPHMDCHICLDSSLVSNGDFATITAWSPITGCTSDKDIINDRDYYLYPGTQAWCDGECFAPTEPGDFDIINDKILHICDKLGLEPEWNDIVELLCAKIDQIVPTVVPVNQLTCDTSNLALASTVQAVCDKFGLDSVPETDITTLLCRKINELDPIGVIDVHTVVCDSSSIEYGLDQLCTKIGDPPGTDDLISKICRIENALNQGFTFSNDKVCHIEDSLGCDKKGKSVHKKLDKIKKQCVKNNKGIKKVYDRCDD